MSESNVPRNRKERRAAARESGKPIDPPTTTPTLKLAQPDRSKPNTKTLLDLYEEKRDLVSQGQPFAPQHKDGRVRDESGNILEAGLLGDDEPIGPVGTAFFWTVSLSMVHFTLDVLVYNQYRQEIEWAEIFIRTALVAPVLFLVMWMMNSELAKKFGTAKQVLLLVIGIVTGCHTIFLTNEYDYYLVMKQAPPLGTLWIWSVIEMRLPYAAVSVLVDLGFLWLKGYSIT